jgi:carboxylate-amine ligase
MDIEKTVGIEEEFFLVDLESLDCIERVPRGFRAALTQRLGARVGPEIMESMIELSTDIHTTVPGAVSELKEMRAALIETAERFGVGVVAAGTHPFADWREQRRVPKPRYEQVAAALGTLSNRIHVCGLHVHVGVAGEDQRVDLMNRVQHLLPLMLALSVSSPFWRGRSTGLASYRSAAQEESPRSGLPGYFANAREFEQLMGKLTDGGLIDDRSFLWWVIRPSTKFPTLELRIMDSCPIIEDVAAIAAFYQSALAWLARNPLQFLAWRSHYLHVIDENRWQAARHGLDGRMVDALSGIAWPIGEAIENWVARLGSEALRLGCHDELQHCNTIRERGTASVMLARLHEAEMEAGGTDETALLRVVDTLRAWTRGEETPSPAPMVLHLPDFGAPRETVLN